jgi:putative transposase
MHCLISNHVHLLLTSHEKSSASLLMKHLGQCYVQFINRTYRRTGSLWEGRFKSCLTRGKRCVLACYRYLELNPVRAGMAPNPRDYPWSRRLQWRWRSEPINYPSPPVFRSVSEERLDSYRELIEEKFDENELSAIRGATNRNYVFGNTRFQKEIEIALGRRTRPRRPVRPTPM